MTSSVQFFGATEEVTGSCHLIKVGGFQVLLDCGLIQGRGEDELRNREPFPFDPKKIDAVVLSHAHIDHSGRLPQLTKLGFHGPIYTHRACRDLCRIMLKDSAYLSEKDALWDSRKRARKGRPPVQPLYTQQDVEITNKQFKGLSYGQTKRILPNVVVRLNDAGHILGSSIIELWLEEPDQTRKLVFTGDLGRPEMPILRNPALIDQADLVIMESTYGDRTHKSWNQSYEEIGEVLRTANAQKGNILIPAFAVGRTQEMLYLFGRYFEEWGLGRWQIFLDSPLATAATSVFMQHKNLFDNDSKDLWFNRDLTTLLPNLHVSRTSQQSMALNRFQSGAIIIAGSGMCTGGRIRHHFKHNLWRKQCHVMITGFQARGTLGRNLVEGAQSIQLWGEQIRVSAKIHTIGGLSAHADQDGLFEWYQNFQGQPPVALVHGETQALNSLSERLTRELEPTVNIARYGSSINLDRPDHLITGPTG